MAISMIEIVKATNLDWEKGEARMLELLIDVGAIGSRRTLFSLASLSFFGKAKRSFSVRCSHAVYGFLRRLGIQRPGISGALTKRFSDQDLIAKAWTLHQEKQGPILVLFGENVDVVACSSLVSLIRNRQAQGEPMLVVPAESFIEEEFNV